MITHHYPESRVLKDQARLILECAGAFYAGYVTAAVVAILPAIEASLRRVADLRGVSLSVASSQRSSQLIRRIMKLDTMRGLRGLDERQVMLDSFRVFLEAHLYATTQTHHGRDELNRHKLLHGYVGGESLCTFDFYRALSALDLICFFDSLETRSPSIFAPGPSEESRRLADRFAATVVLDRAFSSDSFAGPWR